MDNSDIALNVQDVSKLYRIGAREARRDTMAQSLAAMIRSPIRNFKRYRSLYDFTDVDLDGPTPKDVIRALDGVNFQVRRGEVLGIIGVNGAGKSTLLKVLSRITPPTRGRLAIRGRVSSLLEVGTGFHPELTGRENIYLNGTVLGMRKREVDRKFDEIVDFSGVDTFLDTPVKRYSSGMRVRLAFAVAAHLEPEILIIDEVLAVGDASFQRKCLNKMEDVGKDGRTVLFVSHNMATVTRLCPRALLLKNGRIIDDGPADRVVSEYLSGDHGTTAIHEWPDEDAPGNGTVRLRALRVLDADLRPAETIDIRRPTVLEIEFEVVRAGRLLLPHFQLYNEEGVHLFKTVDLDPGWRGRPRPSGRYVSRALIPGNFLAEGRVYVSAGVCAIEPIQPAFFVRQAVAFQVIDSLDGDSARGDWAGLMDGVMRPMLDWETQFTPAGAVRAVEAG